jgi:LPXTG-site transpeptidase (sortase) family protein
MLQLTGPLEAVQTRLRKDAIRVALSEGNAISIPHIGTKKPVLQLPNLDPLLNEFWMLPWGSTPEKGNNTILVAHSYNQQKGKQWPNVLFDLDKVKIGEKITFDWQGKIYIYEVVDNRQFDAKDVYIEDDTKESVLTIYGCGKYTTKYRQVVRAVLVSVQ